MKGQMQIEVTIEHINAEEFEKIKNCGGICYDSTGNRFQVSGDRRGQESGDRNQEDALCASLTPDKKGGKNGKASKQ